MIFFLSFFLSGPFRMVPHHPLLSPPSAFRYPCLAAEVFGCEILTLCECLIRQDTALANFWKFLEKPAPVNPIQASYFCRVFGVLLTKKPTEVRGAFFFLSLFVGNSPFLFLADNPLHSGPGSVS